MVYTVPFDWRLERLLYLCLWADEVRERPFLHVLGLQRRFGAVVWRSEPGWVGVCVCVCECVRFLGCAKMCVLESFSGSHSVSQSAIFFFKRCAQCVGMRW
jgi:hypothetical protein